MCSQKMSTIATAFFRIDTTPESDRKGRLINHCKNQANCKTKVIVMPDGKPKLVFFTIKEVAVGEKCFGANFKAPLLYALAQPECFFVLLLFSGEELQYDYGDRSKEALQNFPWLGH